jgi:hypothetical protein
MSKKKQAAKEKPIATLTIRGAAQMNYDEIRNLYLWLIKEATDFNWKNKEYAPTMTAKFWR